MIASGGSTFPSAKSSAFIGSSNITRAALTTGLEWNLRVDQSENLSRFKEICHQFEELFKHKQSIELEHSWVERYQIIYDNSKQRMLRLSRVPMSKSSQTTLTTFNLKH
jgi:HKD family nuclease